MTLENETLEVPLCEREWCLDAVAEGDRSEPISGKSKFAKTAFTSAQVPKGQHDFTIDENGKQWLNIYMTAQQSKAASVDRRAYTSYLEEAVYTEDNLRHIQEDSKNDPDMKIDIDMEWTCVNKDGEELQLMEELDEEPQERLSMRNQDSLVTLGQGKVSNFSGEAGNLGFTDYKAAFTTDSTLRALTLSKVVK